MSAAKQAGLRTSEVAEQAGVNIQALRYYERCGLLAEPHRSNGGHRLYPPDTVALLHVIEAAQRLGFTLDEVADLLDAGRHRHPSPDLRGLAISKIAEIDQKIADLTAIRTTTHRGRRRALRQPHQLHLRRLPDSVPHHRHRRLPRLGDPA